MRGKIAKVHPIFLERMRKIAALRLLEGRDRKMSSVKRMTLALSRHEKAMEDLMKADFIKDERGQINNTFNVFTIMIVAFIAVVLFGGMIYVFGILNTQFQQIGIANEPNVGKAGYSNLSYAAEVTFGQVNNSIQALRLVAFCLIFGLILGTIVINSFIKVHPVLWFAYVLVVFLAVLLAVPISNAYESLLQDPTLLGGVLASFTGSNFIILNLPIVTAIVGILGGVFLFINIVRAGNEGGLA